MAQLCEPRRSWALLALLASLLLSGAQAAGKDLDIYGEGQAGVQEETAAEGDKVGSVRKGIGGSLEMVKGVRWSHTCRSRGGLERLGTLRGELAAWRGLWIREGVALVCPVAGSGRGAPRSGNCIAKGTLRRWGFVWVTCWQLWVQGGGKKIALKPPVVRM